MFAKLERVHFKIATEDAAICHSSDFRKVYQER